MKKILFLICMAAAFFSCGDDNSSTVAYTTDGAGCLIQASGHDMESRVTDNATGVVTATYVWECADYVNAGQGIDVEEKKVTLIFEGGGCLQLTASMIGNGLCFHGATPVL